jgi:hypothetical protein
VVVSVIIIINKKKLISLTGLIPPKFLESLLTEWSDVFEWLWDFSEWQLSEVGHDWLLGELHELLFGLESVFTWLESVSKKISNMASIMDDSR